MVRRPIIVLDLMDHPSDRRTGNNRFTLFFFSDLFSVFR